MGVSLKIIHIITGLNDGGAESVLYRLCVNDLKNEHMVVSLISGGKYEKLLKDKGVLVYGLGAKKNLSSVLLFFKLFKILKNVKPDVVQTWMYHADLLGGCCSRAAGVKRVFWGIRHSTFDRDSTTPLTIVIAKICAILSRIIPTKIICCADEAMAVHLELGYDKSKMEVVYNGFDLSRFRPDSSLRVEFRKGLFIEEGEFLFGMVARFHPQKDHVNLLEALHILKRKGYKFKLILAGSALDAKNEFITQKIETLNLKSNVLLLGQTTNIPLLMNGLDVHVLSSSYGEAFPNVVAEAMACGIPSVVTNVGDACEIVGLSTLCCEPKDCNELAIVLENMLLVHEKDPCEWRRLKTLVRDRVVEKYDLYRMIERFNGIWK